MKKWYLFFLLYLICASAVDSSIALGDTGFQDDAKIKEVQLNSNGLVVIKMETERNSWAACINTTYHKYHWAFSPSTTTIYKETLATALTAKATGSLVRRTGTGTCDASSNIETVDQIAIK